MTRPKIKCTFDALLRFVAGFLVTRQKCLYFMYYYVEKQVFLWRAKKVQIYYIITWISKYYHDAPKSLIFDALIRGKAGFLVTQPKTKENIWCIITFCSRFSHDAPKTLIFDILLRGKAGFLMTRQNLLYLIYYYVEKQVFSWHAKTSYIWCINTWKSRFSHEATENKVYIWCIYAWKSMFSHVATENKMYIWCIITFRSMFSHYAPKL